MFYVRRINSSQKRCQVWAGAHLRWPEKQWLHDVDPDPILLSDKATFWLSPEEKVKFYVSKIRNAIQAVFGERRKHEISSVLVSAQQDSSRSHFARLAIISFVLVSVK